jgi:hypothetical protein
MSAPTTTGRPTYGSQSFSGSDNATLQPGVYTSIKASGNANITFEPGVYIITGSGNGDGLNLAGNAVAVDTSTSSAETGTGVFFYFTGGTITLSGNGALSLPAPTMGNWTGMSMWLDKNNPDANNDQAGITMNGNGQMNVGGVVYGSTTRAVINGNGDTLGSQLVVDQFTLNGNNANAKFGNFGGLPAATKRLSLIQ